MPPGVRAYSMDLRERVVAAVDAGMSQSQAAERFGVSLRTVERYLARRRATGSLTATEQRHGPVPAVRRQLQAWLPARLAAAADATLPSTWRRSPPPAAGGCRRRRCRGRSPACRPSPGSS
jgi:transposase